MPYISKINIGGVLHDIYDKEARELLAKTLVFVGVTTTAVSDGATTPATYGGLSGITVPPGHSSTDTLDAGTVVIYNQKEFVWDGSKWAEFGDLSDLALSPTYGQFVTTVTATPTNQSSNTGAGSAHSHTVTESPTYLQTVYNGTAFSTDTQSATVAGTVATGSVQSTSAGAGSGVITALTTTNKLVTAKVTPATTGTAVAVFNSITSTQGTDGVKIITDVSGGGQAGEVTTPGVAATVAGTVVTGLSTSTATATGRIAYTAGVTATNKMVTSSFTPVTVGAGVSVTNGWNVDTANSYQVKATRGSGTYMRAGSQYTTSNSDGTNTYTLNLLSQAVDGTTGNYLSAIDQGDSELLYKPTAVSLSTTTVSPAQAGTTPITFATGTLAANGSGSAVATGGTTSYLYTNTATQTTNIPTVVSFGTVVINGTPSYIHTSNIVPAVAGTQITYATGALSANGSGSAVVTGGTTSYLTLDTQSVSVASAVNTTTGSYLSNLSLIDYAASGTGRIKLLTGVSSTTGVESTHTHIYSRTSQIAVTAPTSSALTSVTLVPAS